MKKISAFLFVMLMSSVILFGQGQVSHPSRIGKPIYFDVSPPLRDMVKNAPAKADMTWKDGIVKNFFNVRKKNPQDILPPSFVDPARQQHYIYVPLDTTLQNFAGTGMPNGDGWPPDTDGDVSSNYYFQVVNCKYAIYSKTGTLLLGPTASSTIWNGLPNNSNDGDAVVLYDEQADRWLFSQFSLPNYPSGPYLQMIAVSQTNDPTGSWYRWEYSFTDMPDYPKFGVWPDGYYMSANRFAGGSNWSGTYVCAFDRTAMLAGNASPTIVQFSTSSSNDAWSWLPSDCDGTFPPSGTPNYFTYLYDANPYHLAIEEFHVDWVTPANSTFGNLNSVSITSFNDNFTSNIAQPGTSNKLDPIGDRLMYRENYRKFTDHQAMVLCHTVNTGSNVAGIRWYELRNTGSGWTVYQQSTYNPADGKSRWMGSIALDAAGDIALGYSISSSSQYPSIRYTGRLNGDALNTMTYGEHGIVNGTGSQTSYNRWGDYSAMTTDPTTNNMFWYTQEYVITTGTNWKTRIASFQFGVPFVIDATANPTTVDAGQPTQLNVTVSGGSGIYTYQWTSVPAGFTSTISNPIAYPMVTTKYFVTVNDGSQNRTDSVTVMVNMYVTASANPTTVDPGNTTQLSSTVTGGSGNFTYQWSSNPAGYNSTLPNPTANPMVNTIYTCLVNDGTQSGSDTAKVNVTLHSTATATPGSICLGNSSQLMVNAQGGTGFYTYQWTSNPPGFTSSVPNPVVYPTVNTDYYSQVTDGTYYSYDTVSVTVSPTPTVYSGIDTTVCFSVTQFRISGTATNESSVQWTTSGDGTFGTPNSLSSLYYPGSGDHTSGTATLTLTAYPILPCTNIVTDNRVVMFDACTGIPGAGSQDFTFTIRPNPASSEVTLSLTGAGNESVRIMILDLQGRTLLDETVLPGSGNVEKTCDVSAYSHGIYFVRVIGDNFNQIRKLIVE
ncbi:MAG TPA: T9SS type A sorting domain-containing protein [Bacteroidales bacterium]|nr:T9SS type A sorting domain-containing protein [Bacteroidales bacterium]